MIKLLLLLAVVVLVVWWIRRLSRPDDPPAAKTRQATPIAREPILACAHCGVHVPQSEALMLGDRPYCSEAHRRAHQGDATP